MLEKIDGDAFRKVLGRHPTGVTLVTTYVDGIPLAMVIGSFVSVSIEPPLVAFLPGKDSKTWEQMAKSKRFCVNVLSDKQVNVANEFFSKKHDPWEVIPWSDSTAGLPSIDNCLVSIDCSITEIVEAGDHWFVIGEVIDADLSESGLPLLFLGGSYGQFRSI